jgi:hypothetical protein
MYRPVSGPSSSAPVPAGMVRLPPAAGHGQPTVILVPASIVPGMRPVLGAVPQAPQVIVVAQAPAPAPSARDAQAALRDQRIRQATQGVVLVHGVPSRGPVSGTIITRAPVNAYQAAGAGHR